MKEMVSDEETTKKKHISLYCLLLSYRKNIHMDRIYMDRLLCMKHLKSDSVYKEAMETRNALTNKEGFDRQEASEAALDRKFLLKRLL